jgi:alpha-L-rhamnosidase
MWEAWGLNGRSRNHPMFGTVDDWLFRDVAGIAPAEPGFKRTLIEPHPGPLTAARAEHESPYGEIVSDWAVRDGRFTLGVEVPVNSTATLRVPVPAGGDARVVGDASGVEPDGVNDGYAQFEVGSGRYRFVPPAR